MAAESLRLQDEKSAWLPLAVTRPTIFIAMRREQVIKSRRRVRSMLACDVGLYRIWCPIGSERENDSMTNPRGRKEALATLFLSSFHTEHPGDEIQTLGYILFPHRKASVYMHRRMNRMKSRYYDARQGTAGDAPRVSQRAALATPACIVRDPIFNDAAEGPNGPLFRVLRREGEMLLSLSRPCDDWRGRSSAKRSSVPSRKLH
jgi:hypothetical protein